MIKNMTRGRPFQLLLRFAFPLLIGNFFSYLYNISDTVIAGRVLGENALAAVGATGSLIFAQIGLLTGLSGGLSIVTAQRFGADDHDGMRHSVAMSVYIITAITAAFSLVFAAKSRWMLECMHTPPEIIRDSAQYMTLTVGGSCFLVFYTTLSNILRALGDSTTPLYFLIFSCLLNMALDCWFLIGFGWGVWGTAVATLISQAISGLLCLLLICWKFPILRMKRQDWRWDWPYICEHLRVSLPMGMQWSIMAIGSIVLQFKINDFGPDLVASFVVSGRLDGIVVLPFFSLGMAISTFDAQNYGAGRFDRIRQGFRVAARLVCSFALIMGFVHLFFSQSYASLFLDHPTEEIISYVQLYELTAAGLFLPLGMLIVYRSALQGMGHSMAAFFSGVVEMAMRMSAALFLAPLLGYWGVCMANPLAWIGAFLQLGIVYHLLMHRQRKQECPAGGTKISPPSFR